MQVTARILICRLGLALAIVAVSGVAPNAQRPPQAAPVAPSPSYDQLITVGYRLVKEQKLTEGYAAALHAVSTDPARFEAYALAALALHLVDAKEEATTLVARALERAPKEKKAALSDLAAAIAGAAKPAASATKSESPKRPLPPAPPPASAGRTAAAARPGETPIPSIPAVMPRAPKRSLRVAKSSLGYVNIRKAPAADAPIVGRVRPGEVYTFSTVSAGWYKIDGKGWIAGKYVSVQ